MKTNKFIILLVIFALAMSFTLVGCGSSDEPATDKPAGEEPAAEEPAAEKTYVAEIPENQPLVDMIIPNLKAKVKSEDITQERMDEIIQQVGDGTLSIEQVQAIMMGQ